MEPTIDELYGSTGGLWYEYMKLRNVFGDWNQTLFTLLNSSANRYVSLPNWHDIPKFTADEWMAPPARTIVVPIELQSESWDDLESALLRLRSQCRRLGRTEVILWFNTRCDLEGDWAIIPEAMRDFRYILSELRASGIASPQFRLRVVHRFRQAKDTSEGAFNEIRAAYMDTVIWEARPRHYPYMHPVWWLDLDTPFMSRGCIRKCERALKQRRGHFIKANLQGVGDDPHAMPMKLRSHSEKIAIMHALTQRMLARNLQGSDARGYVEESGLLMALGHYMRSGGVGVCNPLLGESRTLLERAAGVLDPNVPLVYFVGSARLGTSYRNWELEARLRKAWELPGLEEGDDYLDFQAKRSRGMPPGRSDPATRGEIREMIRRMEAIQLERSGTGLTDAQHRRLELMIVRLGFAEHEMLALPAAALT